MISAVSFSKNGDNIDS